ncbi:MAG: DNA polymerase I [Simkaniaceae bacterium]
MDKLYILDAVQYLFRSYFAIKGMTNKNGASTNALFGFIRSYQKILKDFNPTHIIAVFDGPDNKKSRSAIYKEYKSHRKQMPDDLFPQLDLAIKFCKLAGLPFLSLPGVEADDIIGCVAKWGEKEGSKVFVCSSDKDLCQLVNDHIFLLNTYKENLIIDSQKVLDLYGVHPNQIIDYLAITGDTSDNIPGVSGLGPKAASTLLGEYKTLENLYEHIDELKGKRKENLIQYRENAFLSQKLATLHLDLTVPTKSHEYLLQKSDREGLIRLYEEMNFTSLLREIKSEQSNREENTSIKSPNAIEVNYHLINSKEAFLDLLKILYAAEEIAIDTETTKLSPIDAELVGIGFCFKEGEAYYVPFNGEIEQEFIIKELKKLLNSPNHSFFGHNIKYDLHIFENYGIQIRKVSFDTMLASYVISPESNRHGLDPLTLEYFGKVKTAIKSLISSGKKEKSMKDVPIKEVSDYCSEDVDYTFRLKKIFEDKLVELGLEKTFYKIELPLIPVLASMERAGIFLDAEKLKIKSKELVIKIKKLEDEIYRLANHTFNINSPKQLSEVLYTRLKIKRPLKKRGTSLGTGAEILHALSEENPIAKIILKYRQLEKLRSTYVDSLPKQVNTKTGRIHCSFNQSVAATGRLSCTDPNLQNIPTRSIEGRKIREAFHPEKKDSSFLSADYSQIELRILAHLSEDPVLIKAFKEKKDIHTFTASKVFDVPLDEVTKEMRYKAKAVNFGLIYGQGPFGLAQELGIEFVKAREFIKRYFENIKAVKNFLDHLVEEARQKGYASTMTGRRRPLPNIKSSNPNIRAASERLAVNTPFQGTQADIIKMAMLEIYKKIYNSSLDAQMILQIHDELIFEVKDSDLQELKQLVKSTMEGVFPLKVPLTVDISFGKNWGEC